MAIHYLLGATPCPRTHPVDVDIKSGHAVHQRYPGPDVRRAGRAPALSVGVIHQGRAVADDQRVPARPRSKHAVIQDQVHRPWLD